MPPVSYLSFLNEWMNGERTILCIATVTGKEKPIQLNKITNTLKIAFLD